MEIAKLMLKITSDVQEAVRGVNEVRAHVSRLSGFFSTAGAAAQATGSVIGAALSRTAADASATSGALHNVAASAQGMAAQAHASASAMSSAFSSVSAGAVALGNAISSVALGAIGKLSQGIGALASGMIDGNAQFETFSTQFSVLLAPITDGVRDMATGMAAAKERMAELAQFGAQTPFELPEVVKADKILQGFGLHSEEAAKRFGFSGQQIRTIAGDVASGAGASFTEIAGYLGKFASGATGEAIARFQELGIVTREQLQQLGVQFSGSGELTSPLAGAFHHILQVMKDKYGGMMQAQSETFEGMKSNLADWVSNAMRIMGAPIFDALKGQLSSLLTVLGSEGVQNAIAGIGSALGGIASTGVSALQSLASALSPLGSAAAALAGFFADTEQESETLESALAGIVGAGAANALTDIAVAAVDFGSALAGLASGNVDQLVSGLGSGIANVARAFGMGDEAATAFSVNLQAALGSVAGIVQTVAAIAQNDLASAFQTVSSLAGQAFAALPGVLAALLPPLQAVGSVLGSVVVAAVLALSNIANQVFSALPGLIAAILPNLISISSSIGSVVVGALTALGQIAQSVFQALPGLVAIALPVLQAVASFVTGVLAQAYQLLAPLAVSVFQGIATIVQAALPPFMALASAVGALLVAAFGVLQQVATAVFSAIQPYIPAVQAAIASLAQVVGNVLGQAFTAAAGFITGTVIPALVQLGLWLAANLPGAIQALAGFWTGVLWPAISAVAGWVTGTLVPALAGVWGWLATNLPAALSTLAGFWTGTLQPAIAGVWSFIQDSVVPLLQSLGNVLSAVVGVAVEALAGLWQNTLSPALSKAWSIIQDNLQPILASLADVINSTAKPAAETFSGIMSTLSGVMTTIKTVIGDVTGKLNDFAGRISSIQLPDFLQRHSPSPIEQTFMGLAAIVPTATAAMAGFGGGVGGIKVPLEQVKDVLLDLGSFMVIVARQIGKLADGAINTGALQRLAQSIGSIGQALESLRGVMETMKALGQVDTSDNAKNTIAHFVIFVHDIILSAGPARGAIGTDVPGPFQRLADAARSVLSSLTDLAAIAKQVSEFAKQGLNPQWLASLGDQVRALIGAAASLVRDTASATVVMKSVDTSGFKPLQEALDPLVGIVTGTVSLAKGVADALAYDWGATDWVAGATLLVHMEQLAVWLASVASGAALAIKKVDASGFAPLRDALDGLNGVTSGTLSLAKLVADALKYPWGATEWSDAAVMLRGMATLAVYLARGAADAALAIKKVDASGFAPLRAALEGLNGIAEQTMSLARLVAQALEFKWAADYSRAGAMLAGMATLAVYLTRQAADAALAIKMVDTSGLSPLRAALEDVSGLAEQTFSLAGRLVQWIAGKVTLPDQATAEARIGSLVTWALAGATAAGTAAAAWDGTLTPALSRLSTALQASLGVIQDTFSLADAVMHGGAYAGLSSSDLTPLAGAGGRSPLQVKVIGLMLAATQMADAVIAAVSQWDATVPPSLSTLRTALQDSLGLIRDTFETVDAVVAGKAYAGLSSSDLSPLAGAGGMSPLQVKIIGLVLVATQIADAVDRAVAQWTGPTASSLGALKAVLSDSLGLIRDTLDAGSLVNDLLSDPAQMPSADDAVGALTPLLDWARDVAVRLAQAVGSVEIVKENMGAVGAVLADATGAVEKALSTGKLVASLLKDSPNLPTRDQAVNALVPLIQWAQDVASRVALAVGSVNLVKQNIGAVGGVLNDTVGTVEKALAAGKLAASLIKESPNLPTAQDAATAFIPLIQWGQGVATRVAMAVGAVQVAKENIGEVGRVLGDTVGTVEKALETGKLAASLIKESPSLPSETDAANAFIPLVRWGQGVATNVARAVGVVTLAKENISDVGRVLGDTLGTVKQALEAGKQAADLIKSSPSLPTPEDAAGAFLPLIRWARDVATHVATAIGMVTIAKNNMGELGQTLSDTIGIVENGLKLPELAASLANFTGLNMAVLGPKLDLLIANVIEVARRFAEKAGSSGITEAWADAASRLSKVVNDGIGALKSGLEFGASLLDPETVIPSVGQIQAKLNALLTLVREVAVQFAAQGETVSEGQAKAAGTYAAQVKAMFDAVKSVSDAVKGFEGIALGSSGFNNITRMLQLITQSVSLVLPDADKINAVVAAIASALGGLTNLAGAQGYTAGQTWIEQFAQAIRDGLSAVPIPGAPSAGGGRAGERGGAPGQSQGDGAGKTVNITINQYVTPQMVLDPAGTLIHLKGVLA